MNLDYSPYRVLCLHKDKIDTLDFNNLRDAEKAFDAQTLFDKVCLLELSLVNVKLLKEKII